MSLALTTYIGYKADKVFFIRTGFVIKCSFHANMNDMKCFLVLVFSMFLSTVSTVAAFTSISGINIIGKMSS